MFCPLSIDYGNLADWFVACGTLATVIVALRIAGSERRTAERRRAEDQEAEKAQQALVIEEAKRVAKDAHDKAVAYALLVKLGGGGGIARRQELVDDLGGFRRQLDALQAFPMTDPRLFAEIGRAAYECRVEADLPSKSTTYGEQVMNQIAERMSKRIAALEELQKSKSKPPTHPSPAKLR